MSTTPENLKANCARWRAKKKARIKQLDAVHNERKRVSRKDPKVWLAHKSRHLKYRAARKGRELSFDPEKVWIPTHCPVFGTRLEYGGGKKNPNGASIDRFDNSLGYVDGNIRVISYRANWLKSDGTLAEFLAIVEYLKP